MCLPANAANNGRWPRPYIISECSWAQSTGKKSPSWLHISCTQGCWWGSKGWINVDITVALHAVDWPGTASVAGSLGHRGVETRSRPCAISVDNLCACRPSMDICTNYAFLIHMLFIFCNKSNVDKLWNWVWAAWQIQLPVQYVEHTLSALVRQTAIPIWDLQWWIIQKWDCNQSISEAEGCISFLIGTYIELWMHSKEMPNLLEVFQSIVYTDA